MLRAILWDVDGILAETERDGHLLAFNQAFEALLKTHLGEGWRPAAEAGCERIDLKQINRWYAHRAREHHVGRECER